MALHKILSKFTVGLASFGTIGGLTYVIPTGLLPGLTQGFTSVTPITRDLTKEFTTKKFISILETTDFLETISKYKYIVGTVFAGILFNRIGLGNLMYATRNQLYYGVNTIKDNISNFKNDFDVYKKKVLEKFGYLDEKMESNQRNIELVIMQKGDELKCEMKDLKGNQNKTNGMLDLMSDKINIIENQGKYISKGVYLLCNTVINNENFKDEVDQLKQYKKFET